VKRRWILSLSAVAAITVAGTALAAATAKSPKALVLQPADVPAGAERSTSGLGGSLAKSFTVTFNFQAGSREEVVTSNVAVSKTPGDAATVYERTVAAYSGVGNEKALRLPAYGDEQHARFLLPAARAELIVRKNTVVWMLWVENCGPYSHTGCFFGTTPPKLTAAQALAELKKYAQKQKARVGSG
jgi:hypothetical protein